MKFYKKPKLLLILMVLLPWFTLPLLGKNNIKRFWPAALFISIIVKIEGIIAKKRKWWWFFETIHPKISGLFPFIWGPFLIGSMWILKFTYGKFYRFTLLNLVVDSFFSFIFTDWLTKLGIGSLVRLKKIQLSGIFFIKSLLLYGFQFIKEKIK